MDAKYKKKINLQIDDVQSVLDRDLNELWAAFVWCRTEQGHDFWGDQIDVGELSDEGRKILEEMLK